MIRDKEEAVINVFSLSEPVASWSSVAWSYVPTFDHFQFGMSPKSYKLHDNYPELTCQNELFWLPSLMS